jgi:tellurite methyltransferase
MAAARLVRRRLLDPRQADLVARDPIADAVNIPFSELPERVHELPPREQELGVVGPASLVHEVVEWLTHAGRRAAAVGAPVAYGESSAAELGHLWEPNAFLAEMLPRLPVGRALELACGTGRDAIFMSSRGWDVTAVDILPDALKRAREMADRYAAALRTIDWLELDLEAGIVRFERTFDLITVVRYLHRPLFPRFHEWLRPGGSVLYETYTTLHRERHGRPARDAHVLKPGELPALLAGFEIRHHSEAWHGRAHTARVWAVLPPEPQAPQPPSSSQRS